MEIGDPEYSRSFFFFLEKNFLLKNQFFKIQCNAKSNTFFFMAYLIIVN